jgi:hypothetical protein
MKIKLLSRLAGPDGNYPEGSVIDVNVEKAKQLVEGKYAEALESFPVEQPEKPVNKKKR